MKKALFRILLMSLMLSFTGCMNTGETHSLADGSSPAAYKKGVLDGEKELKNGTLAIESFGLPSPWSPVYAQILKQRYGIEEQTVAGCCVDAEIIGHAEGFNSVMDKAIKQRYRKDVFEEAAAEAIAFYNAKKAAQDSPPKDK